MVPGSFIGRPTRRGDLATSSNRISTPSAWAAIRVPGNWQLQGFDVPLYSNIPYPFKRDPPRVMGEPPKEFTTFATAIQSAATGVCSHFPNVGQGVESSSSSTAWTRLSICGSTVNRLATARTAARRHCSISRSTCGLARTSWLPRFTVIATAATSRTRTSGGFSGIFRDVFLWSTGDQHIRDFFVRTDLDRDCRDASVSVEMELANFADAAVTSNVTLKLLDGTGQRGGRTSP